MRTVAAGDGAGALDPAHPVLRRGRNLLGRWLDSSVASLGVDQIAVASQVSEAELQLLVGMGRDPLTGDPLGRTYPAYASVADRLA